MSKELLERELFLGFPVDPFYQSSLESANPHVVSIFVNNDNTEYLQRVTMDEKSVYLGKRLGKMAKCSDIPLLSDNIYSFLTKIIDNNTFKKTPLLLFPIKKEDLL